MILSALLDQWRTEADLYRRRGMDEPATIVESLADELEAHVRAARDEAVNLTEASKISHYSTRQLRRLIREGDLEDVGEKNAPKVRIADLPRKPGCTSGPESLPVLSLEHGGSGGLEEAVGVGRVRVQGRGDEASRLAKPVPEVRR